MAIAPTCEEFEVYPIDTESPPPVATARGPIAIECGDFAPLLSSFPLLFNPGPILKYSILFLSIS